MPPSRPPMAPALPAIALAPSSPRRKDPAAKRTKRKAPPPPSAASPTSPRLKEPPPNARPQEASVGPTALPAKNREAPTEGNKRKTRPPPDTSGAMADPPAKRNTGRFQRTWSPGDEVRILEALATHRRGHGGGLPTAAELFDSLRGRLQKQGVDARELNLKQHSLKRRYDRDAKKTTPPADEHERRLHLLSRDVWGDYSPPNTNPNPNPNPPSVQNDGTSDAGELTGVNHAAEAKSAGKQAGKGARTLDEMRQLHPHFVDTASLLFDSAVTERMLLAIDDNEAQAVDKKIKKARDQLTQAIMKSMPQKKKDVSNGLPHGKNEEVTSKYKYNGVLHDHLKLKGLTMPPFNTFHGRMRKIDAESQILHNGKLQGLVKPSSNTFHGRTEKIDGESQTLHNAKLQGVVKPPLNGFHGRMRKIDAQSQTLHDMKLQGVVKPPLNACHGRTRKIDAQSQTVHDMKLQGVVKPPLNAFHGWQRGYIAFNCKTTWSSRQSYSSEQFSIFNSRGHETWKPLLYKIVPSKAAPDQPPDQGH
ncbi:hypothetical protein U9M48_030237 [Paspalum notatum var. saurae]|uniref:Glabrous enhancer-binding protein-like DBD domain-containing protein n=1 Tax=Paspalum notatum var. saurae TaxID=547442 RepID=A0AAQ3X1W9_PASNO